MQENVRRLERERVLTLLYEAEMKDEAASVVLENLPVPPSEFVVELFTGVSERADELDGMIERYAIDWTIERMATVDRLVLQMAAWEITERPALPIAVIISEAVELAKRFSTDDSGKFVNGVLSAMAQELRPSASSS